MSPQGLEKRMAGRHPFEVVLLGGFAVRGEPRIFRPQAPGASSRVRFRSAAAPDGVLGGSKAWAMIGNGLR